MSSIERSWIQKNELSTDDCLSKAECRTASLTSAGVSGEVAGFLLSLHGCTLTSEFSSNAFSLLYQDIVVIISFALKYHVNFVNHKFVSFLSLTMLTSCQNMLILPKLYWWALCSNWDLWTFPTPQKNTGHSLASQPGRPPGHHAPTCTFKQLSGFSASNLGSCMLKHICHGIHGIGICT